jgi:hypothetical protein
MDAGFILRDPTGLMAATSTLAHHSRAANHLVLGVRIFFFAVSLSLGSIGLGYVGPPLAFAFGVLSHDGF